MSRRFVNAVPQILLGILITCLWAACATFTGSDMPVEPANAEAVVDAVPAAPQPATASLPIRQPDRSTRPIPPGQLVLPAPRLDDSITPPATVPRVTMSEVHGLHEPAIPALIPTESRLPVAKSSVLGTEAPLSAGQSRVPDSGAITSIVEVGGATVEPTSSGHQLPETDPAAAAGPDAVQDQPDRGVVAVSREAPVIGTSPATSAVQSASAVPVRPFVQRPAAEVQPLNPEPQWFNREGSVDSLSDIRIVLPGSGWLYVGRERSDGVPRLLGKDSSGANDTFEFALSEDGLYRLWFQQQDPVTGSLRNERLLLRAAAGDSVASLDSAEVFVNRLPVRSDGEADPSLQSTPRSSSIASYVAPTSPGDVAVPLGFIENPSFDSHVETVPPEPDGPNYATARDLAGAGDPAAALRAFLAEAELYGTPEDPALLFEIADVASAGGNRTIAREYWRLVVDQGGSAAANARRRLWGDSLAHDDDGRIVSDLADIVSAGEAHAEDHLLAASRLDELGVPEHAIDQFNAYIALIPRVGDDAFYYRLAQLLEMPTDRRDLARAVALYQTIINDFPLSSYWESSESRVEYLNRHFFDVR